MNWTCTLTPRASARPGNSITSAARPKRVQGRTSCPRLGSHLAAREVDLFDRYHQRTARHSQCLGPMAFAVHVLDQIDFTGADDPGLTIARRNFVRCVQIDDVLSPGRCVPVKKPVRGVVRKIISVAGNIFEMDPSGPVSVSSISISRKWVSRSRPRRDILISTAPP